MDQISLSFSSLNNSLKFQFSHCRPPFGAHFLQLDFAKCHDLKEPRVHAWLAVGASEWCFLWPTRSRHVSKEFAKSCRRLEERGGQLLGLFPGCWRFFSGVKYLACRWCFWRERDGAFSEEGTFLLWGESPLTTVRDSGETFSGESFLSES